MDTLKTLSAGLIVAGSLALAGCGGGERAQPSSTGMPPDVQAEFNRRMGGQTGTTAPQAGGGSGGGPGGMPAGMPTAPR
jgi:hypothetical protein